MLTSSYQKNDKLRQVISIFGNWLCERIPVSGDSIRRAIS